MDQFRDILLEVWREVGKHLELRESAGAIAALLARHLPLETLLVRRFDLAQHTIETLAAGRPSRRPLAEGTASTSLTAAQFERLLSWAKSGQLLSRTPRAVEYAWLVPPEFGDNVLVGPLVGADSPAGVLLFVPPPREEFHADHRAMCDALLEPFAAALANDRRLHELAALREAAEADRQSLVTRLGRPEFAEEVVGADAGLRLVMERVQLVSPSDVPVLILGETGTGKEVAARAIHNRSPRATGPFIRVNCGAIPPELLDSQLFGHEKGSFTGASETRKGWFERADGGTLFLDEIGELPLAAQVRLLRVLQEHQIERVGGQDAIHVDVRIVAATHRDLTAMVKSRTFREDLWYRINVFPILLPRLRERTEDIPALVRHFTHKAAARFGLPFVEPSAGDLRLLINYAWPGNIRELGAVMDRAVILGNGSTLEVAKSLGLSQPLAPPSDEPTFYEVIPDAAPLPQPATDLIDVREIATLDDAMRSHMELALSATRGRIEGPSGAAELLGINPHTLRARMRKLGIDWSRFRE